MADLQYLADLLAQGASEEDVARALLEMTLDAAPPDVADAVRAAALPAWFDAALLAYLLERDETEAERLLAQIAAFSFVQPREDGGLVYHEATRARLLAAWQTPERRARFAALAKRLAQHYLALAGEHTPRLKGPEFIDALAVLDAAYPNIRAAWENAVAAELWDLLPSFAYAEIADYQRHRGLWQDWIEGASAGVEAYRQLENESGVAAMQNSLGTAYAALPTGDRAANLQQAIHCYEEALRYFAPDVAPLDYATTQNNLGTAYQSLPTGDRAANLQQAIHCYEEALRFRTPDAAPLDYATTQNNLGTAYADLQEREQAEAAYRRAIAANPHDADAWNGLGSLYDDWERFEEAEEAYRHLIQLEPSYAFAYNNLASTCLELGKLDEAAELYAQRIRLRPQDALNAHVDLGIIESVRGNEAEARAHFEAALALWDTAWQWRLQTPAALLENKAIALLGVRRTDEAISTLKEALSQRSPTDTIRLTRYDLWATAPNPPPGLDDMRQLLKAAMPS